MITQSILLNQTEIELIASKTKALDIVTWFMADMLL